MIKLRMPPKAIQPHIADYVNDRYIRTWNYLCHCKGAPPLGYACLECGKATPWPGSGRSGSEVISGPHQLMTRIGQLNDQ